MNSKTRHRQVDKDGSALRTTKSRSMKLRHDFLFSQVAGAWRRKAPSVGANMFICTIRALFLVAGSPHKCFVPTGVRKCRWMSQAHAALEKSWSFIKGRDGKGSWHMAFLYSIFVTFVLFVWFMFSFGTRAAENIFVFSFFSVWMARNGISLVRLFALFGMKTGDVYRKQHSNRLCGGPDCTVVAGRAYNGDEDVGWAKVYLVVTCRFQR